MYRFTPLSQISIRLPTDELEEATKLALVAAKLKRFELRNRSDILREALKQGLVKLASELKPRAPAKPRRRK